MIRVAYSVNEVVSLTGLGRTTVFKLMDEGKLRRRKVGARTLILSEDVDALLQRHAA